MANDPTRAGPFLPLPANIRRGALAAVLAVALAVILTFLQFIKMKGIDVVQRNEVLGYLQELKEVDGRWDLEVLRARMEFARPPPATVDHAAAVDRIRKALFTLAPELKSPALESGLPELHTAFTEKADLAARFKKASAAAKQALDHVMGADVEIAGLVRGSWRDFPDRERLVAVENVVAQLLAEAQRYYFAPTEAQRKNTEALAADLRDAAPRLPPSLTDGIARLDSNLQELLRAKPAEEALFNKLALHRAGPRLDRLTSSIHRELEQALADLDLYRVYLTTCWGALLVLIGYLALRLIANYRLLNQAHLALKADYETLERRLTEGTREPPEVPHDP